jgi:hypothetical protein
MMTINVALRSAPDISIGTYQQKIPLLLMQANPPLEVVPALSEYQR